MADWMVIGMREKLIELLYGVQYQGNAVHGYHDKYIQNSELADHLIANGVVIPEWIPVTERLPERNGTYLVCTIHDFYRTKNVAKASFRSGGFYGQGGHWANVTHWMPLPEPPKGVE